MPDNMKIITEQLAEAMAGLPDEVSERLMREWEAEARGAKKVYDLLKTFQADPAA